MNDHFQDHQEQITRSDIDPFNAQHQATKRQLDLKNQQLNQAVQQEDQVLENLTENNKEIDQFYQEELTKNWTVFNKLGNRSMYEQVQSVKADLFKESAKYRVAFYKQTLDTRLSALSEKCEAGIKMIKAHHRQQVASFVIGKMEQLKLEICSRQFVFLEMMKGKYEYAESLEKYPSMRDRFMQAVFREEEKYLLFLDNIVEKFENIMDEEITKY